MMDFDRKSSNSDDKAQTGRDPLMELARLFGSKPEDAASDNYTGSGYDEPAAFPSLDNDYAPYDAAEPVQEENINFPVNVSETEEDLRAGGYYGQDYGDENLPSYQAQQAPGRYSPVSPDIFNIEDNNATNLKNEGGESYSTEDNCYNAAYPYEDKQSGFADETVYAGIGSHQEEEIQYPEWQDPQYTKLHGDEGNIAQWPQAEPAWSHVNTRDQAFADIFDGHDNAEQPSDAYSGNELSVPDEGTFLYHGEDEAAYSCESARTTDTADEYAVYAESLAQDINQLEQARPAVPTLQVHVQNPANAMFDDAFFTNDMPETPSFGASDDETVLAGTENHVMQESFPEEESVSYPDAEPESFSDLDEGTIHTLDAWPSEENEDHEAESAQPLRYNPYVGFQLGHSYSYIAHPEIQKPVKPIHNNYEEEQDVPAEQDIGGYGAYAVGEEETCFDNVGVKIPDPEIPYQDVTETFPDFDAAIDSDNMYRDGQIPELGTVNPDEARVEETEAFDLPSVHYEDEAARLGGNNPLDQEFADIFALDSQSPSSAVSGEVFADAEENFFLMPGTAKQEAQGFSSHKHTEERHEENINAVYDWAPSSPLTNLAESDAEKDFRKSGRRWLYSGLVVTALAALGTGAYMFFFPKSTENALPAIIHAEQGESKVKPQNAGQGTASGNEQAVYNRVEGNIPSGAEQKSLINKTETPLDMNKIDEQSPLATGSSLDQSSVETLVKTAAAQSTPIHIVPTVTVSPERKVFVVSKPDREAVVLKAGRLLGDENSSIQLADNTGQAAVSAAQQNPVPGTIDGMHENSMAIKESGQAEPSHTVDSVKKIVPPATIPDKPAGGRAMQVTENMAEQASMPRVQSAEVDNTVMAPNDFYMQISSQPSKEAAQQSAYEAKHRFGSVIGNNNVLIVPAAIPGRGTYYRVRVPVGNRNAALNMCERYKQAGGSCFIGR